MTRMYIVRHGETIANTQGLLSGHLETPLTTKGERQAELLGIRLADERFSRIFVSDLGRAVATAEAVAVHHKNVPMEQHLALRECSWGEFEGRPFHEINAARTKHSGDMIDFTPPRGESLRDLRERTDAFIDSVVAQLEDGTYLIVAHSVVNKMLIFRLLQRPWSQWSELHQQNTCVNIIEIVDGRWHEVVLDCARHLEEERTDGAGIPLPRL